MVSLRGFQIPITIMCLVLATGTIAALAPGGVVVDIGAGPFAQEDVERASGDLDPSARGTGNQDPGFFGIAVGVVSTIAKLGTFVYSMDDIAMAWGVPAIIAKNIQIISGVSFGMAALAAFRGFKL